MMVSSNSHNVSPQFCLHLPRNKLASLLRAEDNVQAIAHVGMGHLCRPSRDFTLLLHFPSTPVLGYFFAVPDGTGFSTLRKAPVANNGYPLVFAVLSSSALIWEYPEVVSGMKNHRRRYQGQPVL